MHHHQAADSTELSPVASDQPVVRLSWMAGRYQLGSDDTSPFDRSQDRIESLVVEIVPLGAHAGLDEHATDLARDRVVEAVRIRMGQHHHRRAEQPHRGSLVPSPGVAGSAEPWPQRPISRLLPETVTVLAGSGLGAGPACTDPSVIENLLPWHGQFIVPPATLVSMQPWWVQILENALKLPELGWVTTKSLPIVPSPTATWLLGTVCAASAVGPEEDGAFDGPELAEDELEAL